MKFLEVLSSLSSEPLSWWKSCNAFLLLTITIVFVSSLYGWIFTTISKTKSPPLPPGPRGLPLLGSILSLEPELHTYFTRLGRTYGPIFSLRLGTKLCVVVNSPEIAREVLKEHDIVFANRDPPAVMAEVFGCNDIGFTSYGPQWRMLRKVGVQEMLGTASLDASYTLRRNEIRKMIKYVYGEAGSPVNVGEQIFLVALNVMASMSWGGGGEKKTSGGESVAMGANFQQVVADFTYLLGAPNVSDFFPILAPFDLQGRVRNMRKKVAELDRIYDVIIKQREKMGGDGKDFLQVLLKLKDERNEKTPITINNVKALITDMITAGSDTTSSTIEFAMSELINKPRVMAKAQEELDTVVGKNSIVEESHIHKLPYLNAIIRETLRVHPVLPLSVPHSPSESCTIGGYTIPKGACIFINLYGIHKDPSIWSDPEEFDPEKFLNGEIDFYGNDFRFIPFGSGRRICAGMAMAERMLAFSLGSLLHSFDWKSPGGIKVDVTEKFGIVLQKKLPLVAIPTPRLSDPLLYD